MSRVISPRSLSVAALAAASAALLATSGGAGAAASCTAGKEAKGCTIAVGGYVDRKSGIVVGTTGKGTPIHINITIPGSVLCGDPGAAYALQLDSSKYAVVGKTVKVTGATATNNGAKVTGTVSGSYSVTFTSAKKATLSGKGTITLADGTDCSATTKKTLTRVLGG